MQVAEGQEDHAGLRHSAEAAGALLQRPLQADAEAGRKQEAAVAVAAAGG